MMVMIATSVNLGKTCSSNGVRSYFKLCGPATAGRYPPTINNRALIVPSRLYFDLFDNPSNLVLYCCIDFEHDALLHSVSNYNNDIFFHAFLTTLARPTTHLLFLLLFTFVMSPMLVFRIRFIQYNSLV